ncbi:MAG: hypothetical protein HGA45_26150, partial [Chloroflexales bacterium]|nr:hypothetical protein [Chloroflexales bacterium]
MLRDSALARSGAYLGAMVGVVLVVSKLPYDVENPFEANGHPIAFPGVVGITNLFTYLRPEDRAGWDRLPTRGELADFACGAAIGTAACSAMLGVAAAANQFVLVGKTGSIQIGDGWSFTPRRSGPSVAFK